MGFCVDFSRYFWWIRVVYSPNRRAFSVRSCILYSAFAAFSVATLPLTTRYIALCGVILCNFSASPGVIHQLPLIYIVYTCVLRTFTAEILLSVTLPCLFSSPPLFVCIRKFYGIGPNDPVLSRIEWSRSCSCQQRRTQDFITQDFVLLGDKFNQILAGHSLCYQ